MIYVFFYVLFCVLLAWYNYRRISRDKRIYHGLNGLLHIVFWVVVLITTGNWPLVVALPFIGRVFFDTALNRMRGLPIDYVSRKPKSIVDGFEKWVFGNNGILPKFLYLIISVTLICLSYAQKG